MPDLSKSLFRKTRLMCWTLLPVLVSILAMLAGCATPLPEKPEPTPETLLPELSAVSSIVQMPSVVQLDDGRQGFIISESAQLDDAARREFEIAVRMMNEKDYDKAIELLQKVIDKSPAAAAPYIDLGMAYQHVGQEEQAEKQFKTALEMIPDHPVACNQYGLLCRKAGRFADARIIYEQGLARFPEYYPLHRNLGILCDIYLNDLEDALMHYEAYSQFKPDDKQVKMWIADVNVRLGGN